MLMEVVPVRGASEDHLAQGTRMVLSMLERLFVVCDFSCFVPGIVGRACVQFLKIAGPMSSCGLIVPFVAYPIREHEQPLD